MSSVQISIPQIRTVIVHLRYRAACLARFLYCQCDDSECHDRLLLLPLIAKSSANHWFSRPVADRTRSRFYVSGDRSICARRCSQCVCHVHDGHSISGRVSADLLDTVSRPRAADRSRDNRPLPTVYGTLLSHEENCPEKSQRLVFISTHIRFE